MRILYANNPTSEDKKIEATIIIVISELLKSSVGEPAGASVGASVGEPVGEPVGASMGEPVGEPVGELGGEPVGD